MQTKTIEQTNCKDSSFTISFMTRMQLLHGYFHQDKAHLDYNTVSRMSNLYNSVVLRPNKFEGIKKNEVELEKRKQRIKWDRMNGWVEQSKQSVISFLEDNFSLDKTIKKTNLLDPLSFYETSSRQAFRWWWHGAAHDGESWVAELVLFGL